MALLTVLVLYSFFIFILFFAFACFFFKSLSLKLPSMELMYVRMNVSTFAHANLSIYGQPYTHGRG